MYNRSNKPYMELESNRTTLKTSKPAQRVVKTIFFGGRGGGGKAKLDFSKNTHAESFK